RRRAAVGRSLLPARRTLSRERHGGGLLSASSLAEHRLEELLLRHLSGGPDDRVPALTPLLLGHGLQRALDAPAPDEIRRGDRDGTEIDAEAERQETAGAAKDAKPESREGPLRATSESSECSRSRAAHLGRKRDSHDTDAAQLLSGVARQGGRRLGRAAPDRQRQHDHLDRTRPVHGAVRAWSAALAMRSCPVAVGWIPS